VTANFKLVFKGIMALTVFLIVAYAVSVFYLVHSPMRSPEADFLKFLDHTATACIGFLIGGVASNRLTARK
jgi:hypothetical protein